MSVTCIMKFMLVPFPWSMFLGVGLILCLYYRLPNQKYIANSCLQNSVDSLDLSFFLFPSSYTLFWPSIIWFIYNHHKKKLSKNKLCSLSLYYMSSLIKLCYPLCCLLSMQCQDYSNTKCNLYIYNQSSHTIVYAASILYTRPSYTFINAVSYLYKSIQIQNKPYNIHQYQ